jgi:phosphoglycerate kinase
MSDSKDDQFWVLPLPKWNKSEVPLTLSTLKNKQNLNHLDVAGKRVLCRVDYNVPIKGGKITDHARIDATLDTLRTLLQNSTGKVKCLVLICHLGRPGGNFSKDDFSLRIVSQALQERLGDLAPVEFLPECVGPDVEQKIADCKEGTVFLLENLRFHIEETGKGVNADGGKVKADPEAVDRFSTALSRLGDVYVFEAFGAAHRPHASVVGVDLPQRVAGKLMQKELDMFAKVLGNPQRPFLAIIGGAKVTDKIGVIKNMLSRVDEMIIGGGMAYTFKKVMDGINIGSSLFDKEGAELVEDIMATAKERGVKIHFPVDHVIADKFAEDAAASVTDDAKGIPDGFLALDVGPQSRQSFSAAIGRAKTIIWNGPLGVFEWESFASGTRQAMFDLVEATNNGATTIIGGGDTGSASVKFIYNGKPVSQQVSHVSTGGGSSLVLMEGKMLPGVSALSNVHDLPPSEVNVKDLWMEVHALRDDNRHLRHELEVLKQTVAKLAK